MDLSASLNSYADILGNIAKNITQVQHLIAGCAYLLGIMFIMKALMTLKEHGEQRSMMSQKGGMKEPLLYFFVGGMLFYAPTGLNAFMYSMFGPNATIMAYGPLTNNSTPLGGFFRSTTAGTSLVKIIQTVGLVAFVRGWVLVARAGSQGQAPGGMGKGLIHVLGGVLAINIVGTIDMINNTIYGT